MPKTERQSTVRTIRYVRWQDHGMWLGHIEDYPDYITQGETLKDLQENLKGLYEELTGGHIPSVRKVSKLRIA
jgi:predicted RNase H-like HicB family nuclease